MSRAGVVALRAVCATDLPILFEHQRDPEACRVARFTPRDRDRFTSHWESILIDDTVIKLAVLEGPALAGYIVCFERSRIRQVGYWLGREFWGRGIASRALALALPEMPGRPLYAFVAPTNVGSQRVLEKCGFARSAEAISDPDGPGDGDDDLLYRLDERRPG